MNKWSLQIVLVIQNNCLWDILVWFIMIIKKYDTPLDLPGTQEAIIGSKKTLTTSESDIDYKNQMISLAFKA